MVQPLWKTTWRFLTKLNILLPYNPAIMLLGIYPKELKTYIHTKLVHKCLQQLYTQKPKRGGNSNVHQLLNDKQNVVYPYDGYIIKL